MSCLSLGAIDYLIKPLRQNGKQLQSRFNACVCVHVCCLATPRLLTPMLALALHMDPTPLLSRPHPLSRAAAHMDARVVVAQGARLKALLSPACLPHACLKPLTACSIPAHRDHRQRADLSRPRPSLPTQSQGSGPHGAGPPPIAAAHGTRHYGAFRGPSSANRQYDQATSSDSKQTKW